MNIFLREQRRKKNSTNCSYFVVTFLWICAFDSHLSPVRHTWNRSFLRSPLLFVGISNILHSNLNNLELRLCQRINVSCYAIPCHCTMYAVFVCTNSDNLFCADADKLNFKFNVIWKSTNKEIEMFLKSEVFCTQFTHRRTYLWWRWKIACMTAFLLHFHVFVFV